MDKKVNEKMDEEIDEKVSIIDQIKGFLYDNLGIITLVLLPTLALLWYWEFSLDAQSFTTGPGHLELQLAWDKTEFVDIVRRWGADTPGGIAVAIQRYQEHLIKLVLLFPVYVLTAWFLITWLTQVPRKGPHRWFWVSFLLVIVAGVFDLVENYLHVTTLGGVTSTADLEGIPSEWIFFMSIVVTRLLKILPLLVALALLALALLYRVYYSYYRMDEPEIPKSVEGVFKDQKHRLYYSLKLDKLKNWVAGIFLVDQERPVERWNEIIGKLDSKLEVLRSEANKQSDREEQIRGIETLRTKLADVYVPQPDEHLPEAVVQAEEAELDRRRQQAAQDAKDKLERQHSDAAAKLEGLGCKSGLDRLLKYSLDAPVRKQDEHPERHPRRPIGLAFSGGGIRAACFNLGLVQGLAKYGALPWVDYLTSVSGGGLIAVCMISLLSMRDESSQKHHFNTQWDRFPFNPELEVFDDAGVAYDKLETTSGSLKRGVNKQLKYLREQAYYLMPRRGLLTRDTLRLLGGILVRTCYTLLAFLLALFALSAILYGIVATLTPQILDDKPLGTIDVLCSASHKYLLICVVAGILSSVLIGQILGGFYRNRRPKASLFSRLLLLFALAPFLVTVLILVCKIWERPSRQSIVTVLIILGGSFLFMALLRRAYNDRKWRHQGLPEQLRVDTLVIYMVVVFFIGATIFLFTFLKLLWREGDQIFWIWLPAVFVLGCLIGLMTFRVLYPTLYRGTQEGRAPGPISFWSIPAFRSVFWTLQGLVLMGLVVILVLTFLAFPHYLEIGELSAGSNGEASNVVAQLLSTLIPLVPVGLWAALLANLPTDFEPAENLIAKILVLPVGLRTHVLTLLVIVFNLIIIFAMQAIIDRITSDAIEAYVMGLLALGFLYGFSKITNFNYLSYHYFTRDRLTEVFMRTDVVAEDGSVITARDDGGVPLSRIPPDTCSAPYHIVLTALGLSGSWYLEAKDRKSQPFILSKRYCGSKITGYAKTEHYRNDSLEYAQAISLSAAPLSPSLGHHTFLAQAFMTTLINARLGLWMISPEQYKPDVLVKYAQPYQLESRVSWVTYLWDEATAAVSERRPLINLTDGEHTGDNIGLYPLFQRRCKVIIAGDASDDIEGHCEALFYVLHQVKVDLNIDVDIDVRGLKPTEYDEETGEFGPCKRHVAIGKIHYPDSNPDSDSDQHGWLIYFKPTVTRHDPGTIQGYWKKHQADFPHRTTLDQFFDEKEFEAYRYLGEWTVDHFVKDLLERLEKCCCADSDCVLCEGLLQLDEAQFSFDQFVDKLMARLQTITKLPDDDQD